MYLYIIHEYVCVLVYRPMCVFICTYCYMCVFACMYINYVCIYATCCNGSLCVIRTLNSFLSVTHLKNISITANYVHDTTDLQIIQV